MKWAKLQDGTVWPTSGDDADPALEWVLRYGTADQVLKVRMQAASVVSAYRGLLHSTHARTRQVVRQLRAADQGSAPPPERCRNWPCDLDEQGHCSKCGTIEIPSQ